MPTSWRPLQAGERLLANPPPHTSSRSGGVGIVKIDGDSNAGQNSCWLTPKPLRGWMPLLRGLNGRRAIAPLPHWIGEGKGPGTMTASMWALASGVRALPRSTAHRSTNRRSGTGAGPSGGRGDPDRRSPGAVGEKETLG